MITITPETWTVDALCAQVDPDVFFPDNGGDGTHAAKRVCASCPVAAECLEYALRTRQEHGIWGGLPPHIRARMRRTA